MYFYILIIFGFVSFAVGILAMKRYQQGGLQPWMLALQAAMLVTVFILTVLWTAAEGGLGFKGVIHLMLLLVIVVLHAPMFCVLLAGIGFGVMERILEPMSGVVLGKTYDEAEKAAARHEYERALALYRREKDNDPADAEVRTRMGEVLVLLKRFEQAVEEFTSVLDMEHPDEKHVVYGTLRAADVLCTHLDRPRDAEALLERVLAGDLSDEAVKALRARVNQGNK
jgi:tetratricopeptide (TPR) repeat protein